MKYIYVVTRIVKSKQACGVAIPNLGVHTSERSARDHFESVIQDRTKYGRVVWDRDTGMDFYRDEQTVLIREAHCQDNWHGDEFLRLEKWKIG